MKDANTTAQAAKAFGEALRQALADEPRLLSYRSRWHWHLLREDSWL